MQLLTIISSLLGDPLRRMTRRLITDGGLIMNWQFEPADVAMICETANHSGKNAGVDIVLCCRRESGAFVEEWKANLLQENVIVFGFNETPVWSSCRTKLHCSLT